MASNDSARVAGTTPVVPTGYAQVRNQCKTIAGLLKTTSKTGARDLNDVLDNLAAAADTQDSSLPKPDTILAQLRAVEAAVRYWTDKGFDARLQRTRDRLSENETPNTLSQCCTQIQNILSPNAGTNTSSEPPSQALKALAEAPHSPPEPKSTTEPQLPATSSPSDERHATEQLSATSETKTKDAILGDFKAILKSASGVADVIPDPVGKIVKMIADTGVKVMEVLDDVNDNKDGAIKLGAHIRSLVQAIVQYLPHKKGMSKEGVDDVGLVNVLNGFLSTLKTVLTGLEVLRSQGRFKQIALHEQNKSEIEEFGKDIERAFQALQVRLELRALHLLYGIETANIEDRRQRLLDRLGGSNNGVQEKGSSSAELVCLPGTRTSVLTVIEGWMSDPSSEPVLWLNAVAGCGKSTIASTVAHRQNELGGTIAIFYCTAGDQAHCGTIIRSLAFGLARSSRGSLETPILEAIKNEPNVANLTLADQARLLLSEPLKVLAPEAPPAVLVIDGLDEWYDARKATTLVSILVNMAASVNVKILVASRDEQHIRAAFTGSPHPVCFFALDEDVEVAAVNGDIRAYLEYHVKELHRMFGLDPQWPGGARMESLVRKSEGLFQFAATVLRFLRSGYPPAVLNSILDGEDSSSRLDDLYLTIFGGSLGKSLDRSTYPLLKHVLQCLVCAPVPISLEIIAYLWSDSGTYASQYNTVQHSILDHLGSFVVVPANAASPIRFLHTSIVDFLTDPTRCTDERFFVDTTKGHAFLAALCLKRLNRDLKQNICGLEDYMCSMDESEHEDEDDEDEDGYDDEDEDYSEDGEDDTGDESGLEDGVDADTGLDERDEGDPGLKIKNTPDESTSQKTKEESGSIEGSSSSGAHLEKHAASHTVTPEKVNSAICPGLRYGSLYWATHLDAVPTSKAPANLLSLISDFASQHTLHWLEVLVLLHSVLSVGHPAARKAAEWSSRVSSDDLSAPCSLFRDTTRLIGLFASALSSQPLTLYEYILSFVPTESMLRKTYGTRHDLRFKVIRGPMQKRWPTHQWTANHGREVNCIAISPDGSTIASGGDDKRIKLWDAASGMPKGEPLEGHTGWVRSLIFNRDGKLLVSSSADLTIRIWDVETGRTRGDPFTGHTDKVQSVALSPDGTIVASGSADGTVRFWGLESGRETGEPLKLGAGRVKSVAFTPDGSTVVCGCSDGSVRRWKVQTREEAGEAMAGHTKAVWSVCVSPNGKIILSGSGDKSIRMWNAATGEQIGAPLEGHTRAVTSVAFSPDGETIVSGSNDRTIWLWDARTGKQRGKALTGHTNWVRAVAFSPNGKTIVSGSYNRTVRAWDVDGVEDEGEEVEGHSEYVYSAAFTSDARFAATGSGDGSMMVWSAETGLLVGKVGSGYGRGRLQFSANGTVLREDGDVYSGWDGVVREWDVSGAVEGTGAEIRQVEPDGTLEFPDLGMECLWIDGQGWIERDGRKWLWVPHAYGRADPCHLLGTKLVLLTLPIHIIDVANLL